MTKPLLTALVTLSLVACDRVANIHALKNGACLFNNQNSTSGNKVQFLRTEENGVIRCTIEFEEAK